MGYDEVEEARSSQLFSDDMTVEWRSEVGEPNVKLGNRSTCESTAWIGKALLEAAERVRTGNPYRYIIGQ